MRNFNYSVDWKKTIRIKLITDGLFDVMYIDPDTKMRRSVIIGNSPLIYELYHHGTSLNEPWYRVACLVDNLISYM